MRTRPRLSLDSPLIPRLDFLSLELDEIKGNCVHDRFTVLGGKDLGGNLCGDRSGEVTLIEPNEDRDPISVIISTQSEEWRWNIGVQQVGSSPCSLGLNFALSDFLQSSEIVKGGIYDQLF